MTISAGCWVHFAKDRIYLGDRPEIGFAMNTQEWHDYRILREKGLIRIFVDGRQKLKAPIDGIWVRPVRFGNRAPYEKNQSVSQWRQISVQVDNANDTSIDWSWDPGKGYPDQFRRDRTVVLDYSYPADCGYSSWTQLPDGRIVIVDYTTGGDLDSFSWGATGKGSAPFIRSYLVTENDLTRP